MVTVCVRVLCVVCVCVREGGRDNRATLQRCSMVNVDTHRHIKLIAHRKYNHYHISHSLKENSM